MIAENTAEIRRLDTSLFPFQKHVEDFVRQKVGLRLEELHTHQDQSLFPGGLVTPGQDNNTPLHEVLYSIFQQGTGEGSFLGLYRSFVRSLQAHFGCELVFQTKPTFRIHLPGNLSVGAYHRDSEYNHPLEEINLWVPLTRAYKTATIWMESAYDKADYQPKELEFGQFLIFDSRLKHGNEVNREPYTRVSFDFRVIPLHLFKNPERATANRGKRLALGDYYDRLA